MQKQEKAVELVDIWTAILDAGEAIKALGGSYPDEQDVYKRQASNTVYLNSYAYELAHITIRPAY